MYLTIAAEKKPNSNITVYYYRVSKYHTGTGLIKLGATCELRTINQDFKLNLDESRIDFGCLIKLAR